VTLWLLSPWRRARRSQRPTRQDSASSPHLEMTKLRRDFCRFFPTPRVFFFLSRKLYFCPLRTTTDASPSCIRTPPRRRRHCCHRIHSKKKHSRHPSSPRQRQTSQLKKSHRVTAVVRPHSAHPSRDLTRPAAHSVTPSRYQNALKIRDSSAVVVRPHRQLRCGRDRRERKRPGGTGAPPRRLEAEWNPIIGDAQGLQG
jgi:hypothetical protein